MTPWKIASCPEEAGISSKAILNYLDAVKEAGQEPHSVMILKDGVLAASISYAPYSVKTPHVLYSLSKSFTSAAAGFAVAEGLLSWDSRVIDVLSDKAPAEPDEWLQKVTLHHLLSMSSGLDQKSDQISHLYGMSTEADWAEGVLSYGCNAEPGTRFHYNSHGSYLVSAMVQKVCGMNIRDYLMPRLFEPLGIAKPEWDMSPQGICCGGWGLRLSCESIARFGLCLLQEGMWQGRRILPAEWIEKAPAFHTDTEHRTPAPTIEWAQGYCYQFWRCTSNRYRGDGMYGQLCIVSPHQNMVVAVTAGLHNMAGEMELLNEHIFAENQPEATEAERELLAQRLSKLSYPWPEHDGSVLPEAIYANDDVCLKTGRTVLLSFHDGSQRQLTFSFGHPLDGQIAMTGAPVRTLCACGCQSGILSLCMRSPEGPYTLHVRASFDEEGANLHWEGIGFETREMRLYLK